MLSCLRWESISALVEGPHWCASHIQEALLTWWFYPRFIILHPRLYTYVYIHICISYVSICYICIVLHCIILYCILIFVWHVSRHSFKSIIICFFMKKHNDLHHVCFLSKTGGTGPPLEVGFDRDDDFVRGVCDHLCSRLSEATAQERRREDPRNRFCQVVPGLFLLVVIYCDGCHHCC